MLILHPLTYPNPRNVQTSKEAYAPSPVFTRTLFISAFISGDDEVFKRRRGLRIEIKYGIPGVTEILTNIESQT
jgi:hypothetical protein